MKAILHTGALLPWLPDPEQRPWVMLPVGNRPILEYWIECFLDLGIKEIRLVLGDGGYVIEQYAEEGQRWGVEISYSFLKPGEDPDGFPRRSPDLWKDGLFYVSQPCFPLRRQRGLPALVNGNSFGLAAACGFCSSDAAAMAVFLGGAPFPSAEEEEKDQGFSAYTLGSPKAYFDLNMRIIKGEVSNYLAPGYELREGSHIGYNVILPPSVILEAPVMIGNDVRLCPLCAVGPHAVIGNSVVLDSQAELRDCVILDGSYIGRNLNIEDKIVAGNLLIDPQSGESFRLDDPLLLGDVGGSKHFSDGFHSLMEKLPALGLWLLFMPGFLLVYFLILLTRSGKMVGKARWDRKDQVRRYPVFQMRKFNFLTGCFVAMSLDRWPGLGLVLLNRFALCGHAPLDPEVDGARREKLSTHVPGVFYDALLLPEPVSPMILDVYALNYVQNRSLDGDVNLFFRVWIRRMMTTFTLRGGGAYE